MALTLMYITNNPEVALMVERLGVERVWVDLETLGKEERQKNMDTVKSNHTIEDVVAISKLLTKAEMLVRVNPMNPNSKQEIEAVIDAGAQRIMLPMWKTREETDTFLQMVNGRVHTTLLLETKEAVECIDEVLENPLLDEIHIGLNDLHLSYGLSFMFELLANGLVESLCEKFQKCGIAYGFGGVAGIGEGLLPAENIIMEHYRLGSTRAILSRSFCEANELIDLQTMKSAFSSRMVKLRNYERVLEQVSQDSFEKNKASVKEKVDSIVEIIKREKGNGC